jgi:hypothetical protein
VALLFALAVIERQNLREEHKIRLA